MCLELTLHCTIDFHEDALSDLIEDLRRDGYEPYLTSVGGSGLGVLSPYIRRGAAESLGRLTPPETPGETASQSTGGEGEVPLNAAFETTATSALSQWAEELGRWLYV